MSAEELYQKITEFLWDIGVEEDDILPADDALAAACTAIAKAVKERSEG
jgi:hypothetical protein